jgi:exodeoxyribonuclease V alpha subunit
LRGDGSVKKLLPARLLSCETVYAMTIHKSQGSEYDSVLVVLPEKINPVLSKELLYTAITRARIQVGMVVEQGVFRTGVCRKVQRQGGLAEKLLKMQAEVSAEPMPG